MGFNEITKKAVEAYSAATEAAASGDLETHEKLLAEAEGYEAQAKAYKAADDKRKALEAPVMDIKLPVDGVDQTFATSPVPVQEKETVEQKVAKNIYQIRYNNIEGDNGFDGKAITEIYEGDYRQKDYDQTVAMRRFLKSRGEHADRALTKQWYPADYVKSLLRNGMTVAEIKATQMEGVDILGGYAVPPEMANTIIRRSSGLTAMRAAGARVFYTTSGGLDFPQITGGTDQYPSGLRGYGSGEIDTPTTSNFNVGSIKVPTEVYSFKVPMSVSLLEDAQNILDYFVDLTSSTIAVDEDGHFFTGDGANKPRGILPGQANSDGIAEVVTGNASALTITGLKKLRRGVASQYRLQGQSSLVGSGQAGEDLELLQDGQGRFYYDELVPNQPVRGGFVWRESDFLADPAASAYPLIFGDFSGYAIVERPGMTIVRFQDSNTGVNKVEYHIRRRIGGRVIEPWKFAVQKVAAS